MFVTNKNGMAFHPLDSITDFLLPLNISEINDDIGFKDMQLGKHIDCFENSFPDIEKADVIIIGCNETRGENLHKQNMNAADEVRKQLYRLYSWHNEINIVDAGNVKSGATLQDSYAALKTVIAEFLEYNKRVVILGGSHDLTLAQYGAYTIAEKVIEATCVDAKLNLNIESDMPAENFLMPVLTAQPNYIKHYNHIGFQSYLVHPGMLETIDKLRFDCFRVGHVKENMEEVEPAIRNSDLFSFDIAAIQNSYAPANHISPNGFTGEEACALMQFAGMSSTINTVGIYGYLPAKDVEHLTAKQISQMIWYFLDGMQKSKMEADLNDAESFTEYKLVFAEMQTSFLQSKKTGRWWMQLPSGNYTACSHHDYITASKNEIPERWFRIMERS